MRVAGACGGAGAVGVGAGKAELGLGCHPAAKLDERMPPAGQGVQVLHRQRPGEAAIEVGIGIALLGV